MKISFVIPNFNGEEILNKNLPKVIEAAALYAKDDYHKAEIILVDDCSKDRSVSVINNIIKNAKHKYLTMKLITNPINKGFSSTVNNGAREAIGEILILLNTDVYPEKKEDFFSDALKYFDDPKVFAVGFMDKSIEDGKVVLRGRGIGIWKRGFLLHRRGEVDKKNTLWVSGGSSAYRKSIWDQLNGMNEMYNPFYWEDIDLSYRGLKRGYKIVFEPNSVVVHEHDKGSIKKSRKPFAIQTIAYRNQLQFVWMNATDGSILLSHIFWLPFHLFNTLIKGDTAFSFGLFYALLRLPAVLKKRSECRTGTVVSDKEIVEVFAKERID